jgi:hypothetical protein
VTAIRLRALQARLLPRGLLDLLRQGGLFVAVYYLYKLVRGLIERPQQAGAAFQHARELIKIERTLHLFVEPSVQAWASGSHFVIALSSWLYLNAQTSLLIGGLAYLYFVHNRQFYFVRNMVMIAMVIALLGYALYPTAPPRLLPEYGFFDAVSDFSGISLRPTSGVSAFFNPYAAVPSMHVAFALMLGWPIARLVRWRVARVFWLVYPLLITFVIVVTANHFLLDAVLGALTAGVSAVLAHRVARWRPGAWSWVPAPAEREPRTEPSRSPVGTAPVEAA